MFNYEIIMYWSKLDNCFIVEVPELSGCMAHGNTEMEALQNIQIAKELWLEMAQEIGREIPEPKGRLIYA